MATSWGQQLKRWREEAGLSRPALARLAHVSVKNIYNLETHGQRPNSGSVTALVDALDRELAPRSAEWVADGRRRLRQVPSATPPRMTQQVAPVAVITPPTNVSADLDDSSAAAAPPVTAVLVAPTGAAPAARARTVGRLATMGATAALLGIGLTASGSADRPPSVSAGPPQISPSMHAPRWYLTSDPTATRQDGHSIGFGQTGDVPLVGDWDGDGSDTPTLYRSDTAELLLDPSPVSPRIDVDLGNDAWPLSGDWDGDAHSELGYYLPDTATFVQLGPDYRTVVAEYSFGPSPAIPVVGDWNGDGRDEVGAFIRSDHLVVRRGPTGEPMAPYRVADGADRVFGGNWDDDPADELGYYENAAHRFVFLSDSGDTAGSVIFGDAEQQPMPVIGDWNGDGIDTQGVVQDKDKG